MRNNDNNSGCLPGIFIKNSRLATELAAAAGAVSMTHIPATDFSIHRPQLASLPVENHSDHKIKSEIDSSLALSVFAAILSEFRFPQL